MLAFGLSACGGDDDDGKPPRPTPTPTPEPEPVTIVDVAQGDDRFDTLVQALTDAELVADLSDPTATFTVFAPTDDAFDALGIDLSTLAVETLRNILRYHVINGTAVNSADAAAAAGTTGVEMFNGDNIALSLSGDDLLVNLSTVIQRDIVTDNGIIHVIDAVLMPPAERGDPTGTIVDIAVADGNFTQLVAAVTEAGLADDLSAPDANLTVFAPTDAAFAAIGTAALNALIADVPKLTDVLELHVLQGQVDSLSAYAANGTSIPTLGGETVDVAIVDGALTVGGATVVTRDIYASNGIIHVIDAVITNDIEIPQGNIVEVAVADGRFTTLAQALADADLVETLSNAEGTFTVFAPTDEAFAALPAGTLAGLEVDELRDILLYHVIVDAEVPGSDATAKAESEDPFAEVGLNGDVVTLSLTGTTLYVNTSAVVDGDVGADNGVIHVIDKVLLPPEDMGTPTQTIAEIVVEGENFSTLETAVIEAELDGTLSGAGPFTVFAPTNDAFAKIQSDLLAAIIADVPTLTDILELHVVNGASVDSIGAFSLNGGNAPTLGGDVPVVIEDGVLKVGGAAVTMYDVYATNGIIHVIDTVIVGDVELPDVGGAMTLPVDAGWSNDGKANAIGYDMGVTITPDWSTEDDTNIAMYVLENPMDFTGKTVTYVIDVPASYIGSGFNYQPFVQQDSGSYGGSYAGFQPFSALTAGENTVTFVVPGDVPADIQRVGLQVIGGDGGTTDVITIKSVTVE